MGRRAIPGTALLAALVVAVSTLSACGGPMRHALSVTVTSPTKGKLAARVTDDRTGKHTVWVVLDNPPRGRNRELLASFNHGDRTDGSVSSGSSARFPPGVYRYVVYGADGVLYTGDSRYWTPQHQLDSGQVTVR